jgi:hypothetical protein
MMAFNIYFYFYHLILIFPSLLLSENIKIEIYRTIILHVFLYGREASIFTLRKEHRLWGVWEQGTKEKIWPKM